jgi:hypothetical protein
MYGGAIPGHVLLSLLAARCGRRSSEAEAAIAAFERSQGAILEALMASSSGRDSSSSVSKSTSNVRLELMHPNAFQGSLETPSLISVGWSSNQRVQASTAGRDHEWPRLNHNVRPTTR